MTWMVTDTGPSWELGSVLEVLYTELPGLSTGT